MSANIKDIKVGLFGPGNVGSGVLSILKKNKNIIQKNSNINFLIHKILVRDKNDEKYSHLNKEKLVTDYNLILDDEEISVIIETMGGIDFSDKVITAALIKGKIVITANKDLLFSELNKYIDLCKKYGGNIGFEAAVCGGIPIINTLLNTMQSDNISICSGIMNGTTNYILSEMEKGDKYLKDIIVEAQEKGYAEPDPTSDVEGFDIKYKIGILAKIIYGMSVNFKEIWSQGISRITNDDFKYSNMLNSTIKMIAYLKKIDNSLKIIVTPMIVNKKYIESNVKGATNMVFLKSKNLEQQFLIGEGAGKFPTANSIISDLINLTSGKTYYNGINKNTFMINDKWKSRFYIRFRAEDNIGLISNISKLCVNNNISINSILQLPIENYKNIVFVLITEECNNKNIKNLIKDINKEKILLKDTPFYMPIYER